MRTIAALLAAFPLVAAAQAAPPPQTWTTEPPVAAPAPAAQPAPAPAEAAPAAAPAPQQVAPAAQPAPAAQAYPPPPQAAPPAAQPPRSGPPPQNAPLVRGPQRDTWYIGFGVGGGNGKVADDTATVDFRDLHVSDPTNAFVNFKVGWTLTPKLLLGFDMGVMSSGASSSGVTTSLGIVDLDVMATVFPWERGFFLKGGFGRSTVAYAIDDVLGKRSGSADGWNVAGGVGYAWWIGQHFNLTANLDFTRQWYGTSQDLSFTDSQFWALWLGFDWY